MIVKTIFVEKMENGKEKGDEKGTLVKG